MRKNSRSKKWSVLRHGTIKTSSCSKVTRKLNTSPWLLCLPTSQANFWTKQTLWADKDSSSKRSWAIWRTWTRSNLNRWCKSKDSKCSDNSSFSNSIKSRLFRLLMLNKRLQKTRLLLSNTNETCKVSKKQEQELRLNKMNKLRSITSRSFWRWIKSRS